MILTNLNLQIFRVDAPIHVLGPYRRAVIWVQGCTFACKGCIVPESWDTMGGETRTLDELTAWVLEQPNIEGITLSGGEPMLQASVLGTLIDRLREQRDIGVVCYTGDRIERLQAHGTIAQRELLQRLDLIIDGIYVEAQHADLLWRGSTNQRLLPLSDRYRELLATLPDRSAGMEFNLDPEGAIALTGVPSSPRFREAFETRMANQGVILSR
jgi:anaerobic ribonucleoside-triphosphate reductase activating protein